MNHRTIRARRASWAIIAALAIPVALTGCSPTSVQPTARPTASSTSTPTPAASAAATGPFSLACSALLRPSTLSAIDPALVPAEAEDYDVAPLNDAPDTSGLSAGQTADFSLGLYAARESGFFDCRWTSPTRTVIVSALPNGTGAYQSIAPDTFATGPNTFVVGSFAPGVGDSSIGGCESDGATGPTCLGYELKGTLALSVQIISQTATTKATLPAAQKLITSVLQDATALIGASGGHPAPLVQPSSRWKISDGCSTISSAVASVIRTSSQPQPGIEADDDVIRYSSSARQLGGIGCEGYAVAGSPGSTDVVAVPGAGDWGFPIVYQNVMVTDTPQIVGTSAAQTLCITGQSDAGDCWVDAVIDHAIVTVSGSQSVPTKMAIMAAIAQSPVG